MLIGERASAKPRSSRASHGGSVPAGHGAGAAARLPGGQLQMISMVAGTMLRGMFRIGCRTIRELKERTNDPLRRRSAHDGRRRLRAQRRRTPRNVFVGPARQIRMIAATTLSEYKEYIQETKRSRAVPVRERLRADDRRRGVSCTACVRGGSAITRSACWTKRSRPRSKCRRATCATCTCPTR